MKIQEFNEITDQGYWLSLIKKSDWKAGKYLYELLTTGKFHEIYGQTSKVLLLTKGKILIAFCTLAEQDDIRDKKMTPWIGFVYTFPQFRRNHYAGKLLEYSYLKAKKDDYKSIYILTNSTGIYEKYGYSFYKIMKDVNGEDSRVYKIDIEK